MLLSCATSSSYLWVGKQALVPLFSRKTGDAIHVPAGDLTEAELIRWAKNVKRPREGQQPFACEKKFTEENLIVERCSV